MSPNGHNPPRDEMLARMASPARLDTIDDALAVMTRLDQALAPEDGVRWFNYLYLEVTRAVKDSPPTDGWEAALWLERLDVNFARLYFASVVNWARNRPALSSAWLPLFEARDRKDAARVQFALAGMNAHINHDLAIALVTTGDELGIRPRRGTPQHRDFERVNTLLAAVQEQVKQVLATGIAGQIDQDLGTVDDVVAAWSVERARDTAWTNGELLWRIRNTKLLRPNFLHAISRLVGLAGRGLLAPTL
jgi:hypothetical protein